MRLLLLICFVPLLAMAAEPPTLLARRGKLLVEENFAATPPAYVQKPGVGFASGFAGWRFNTAARGGTWSVVDGTWQGIENPAAKHPATTSYGFNFTDVIIQAEVRMDDVPLDGRPARHLQFRTTDEKDYVCSLILKPDGFRIQKDDNDHGGPDKAQPLGQRQTPLALGTWHTCVLEILGAEMVGTVDGQSLTGTHPFIATAKKSVMFVVGGQGSVRNFQVYAAEPNPEWPRLKATLSHP